MSEWLTVGQAAGLAEGTMLTATHGDLYLAVARVNGELYAFDDTCSHEWCPLSEGRLDEYEVICRCHGSSFDIQTGAVLLPPATEPIKTYPVRVTGDEIQVQVD